MALHVHVHFGRARDGIRSVPHEPGHIYHATNTSNLADIKESGKLTTHRPNYGTEQSSWPDGSTKKRSYWGDTPSHVAPFAPEEGKPAIIRAKREHVNPMREKHTGDLYSEKPVHIKHLEHFYEGKWQKLGE